MTIGAKFGMPTPPPNPYSPIPQVPQMGNMPFVPSGMGGMGGMPPMGGRPSPMPMGGPGTFPVNPNMGGNAAPVSQGSNAPRRRMFGDYLEGTLSRNMPSSMPANATSMGQMNVFTGQQMAPQMAMRQRRPMPMPQQRRPMMANRGGIVGFDNGGVVNVFDPESKTYTIRDLESGENEQYSFGSTYGEQDLPADVAYSKQVQENRAGLGLESNDSSAWSLYQRGEHYSQYKPPVVDSVIAEDTIASPVDTVVSSPVDIASSSISDPVVSSSISSLGSTSTASPVYAADPVDESFSIPIDYDNFVGDTVASIGNYGSAALYGPKVAAPATISQVVSDGSGGLGYTNSPFMSSISGIGGINLPARPVTLDIFDFLSEPAYGSLDRFEDGGPVQHFDMGGHAHPHGGGNPYAAYASSMRDAGIGNLSGKTVTSTAKTAQDRAMDMVKSMNKRDDKDDKTETDAEIIEKYTDTSDMNALDQLAQRNFIKDPNIIDNILAGAKAGTTNLDSLNNSDIFAASVSPGTDVSNLSIPLDAVVNYANTANDPVAVDYSNILSDDMSVGMADDASAAVATGLGQTTLEDAIYNVMEDFKTGKISGTEAGALSDTIVPRGPIVDISSLMPPAAPIVDTSAMDVPASNNMPVVINPPSVFPSAPRDDNTAAIRSGLGSVTDGKDPYAPIGTGMTSAASNSATVAALKGYEGFRNKAYDDRKKGSNDPVYRAGFGSDTYTDPETGKYYTVGENTVVTLEQAEADLARRVEDDFIPAVVDAVGMEGWANMDAGTRAALTSIAYNYGQNSFKPAYTSKPKNASMKKLVEAMKTGNKEKIATAIEGLKSNPDRRRREAAMVRSGEGPGGVKSSALYGASNLESNTPAADMSKIDTQLQDSVPVQGLAKFLSNIGGMMFLGLGKGFVDDLVGKTEAQRANVVKMHTDALDNGATPQYDDEGKYIGYDKSTMGTFADKVLASDDINVFLPPTTQDSTFTVTQDDLDMLSDTNKLYAKEGANLGSGLNAGDQLGILGVTNPNAKANASGLTDADGNVIKDIARFQQVFDAQSKAAEADPYGSSTENGFITSDGREFVVTLDGKLLEVENSGDPFLDDGTSVVGTGETLLNSGVGTGTDVKEIINRIIEADPDRRKVDDDDVIEEVVDTGYTVDENGNRVCNTAGYVYDAETDACVLASERKTVSRGLNRPRAASRFNTDYGTQTGRVNIAPLNEGGMVNTNRMVDEFLVALGA